MSIDPKKIKALASQDKPVVWPMTSRVKPTGSLVSLDPAKRKQTHTVTGYGGTTTKPALQFKPSPHPGVGDRFHGAETPHGTYYIITGEDKRDHTLTYQPKNRPYKTLGVFSSHADAVTKAHEHFGKLSKFIK